MRDSTLELFDYPLDYNIVEEGSYYHDPTIPEGEMTWLYTTVKPDYQFPNIRHEIIEECYIPDDSSNVTVSSTMSLLNTNLEMQALYNSGLYKSDTSSYQKGLKKGWFSGEKPDGYILVDDTEKGEQPVKGVKVRCHIVVKWATDFTNEKGYYKMSSKFPIGPHYAVVFDNSTDFTIWGNWKYFAAANYNCGWHSKNGYNKTFTRDVTGKDADEESEAWSWAEVNNAGYDYRKVYCPTYGIKLPPNDMRYWVYPLNSITDGMDWAGSAPMLHNSDFYINITTDSGFANFMLDLCGVNLGVSATKAIFDSALPDVFIFYKYSYNDSPDLFETVCHETAHASHFAKVGQNYWQNYIGYIIGNMGYGKASNKNAGYAGVSEMWASYIGTKFSRIEYGESINEYDRDEWFKPMLYAELIDNKIITIDQIFSCMSSDITSINSLKNKLIEKYGHKDEIITLFNKYYSNE